MFSTTLTTVEKDEIIKRLAHGETPFRVSQGVGVSRASVNNIRRDNRNKIEQEAQRYLDALPDMVKNDLKEIEDYYAISAKLRKALLEETDEKNMKALQDYCVYIDKRITDIKRSVGLYTSHAPSLVFQQLNVIGKDGNELLPMISQLLGGVNQQSKCEVNDIIDVEATEALTGDNSTR